MTIAWVVFAAGLAVGVLAGPWVTSALVKVVDSPSYTGLDAARTTELAQDARSFVADPRPADLPAAVDGRPGFDAATVSHLLDVRRVLAAARIATGALAFVLAAWVVLGLTRQRRWALHDGLLAAGIAAIAAPVVLAALAVIDFGAFFARFHGLFFTAGTWVFSDDALIIQLFPEPFWMWLGAGLGVLIAAFGGVLLVAVAKLQLLAEDSHDAANV